MENYSLLEEGSQAIPQHWFDAQVHRHQSNPALKVFNEEEVAALQAWHAGKSTLEEAAQVISRPIVESPIPDLGTYSDEITALCQLWQLLIDALIEWPSAYTPQLLLLLSAISKVPGGIHQGKATDENGKPLTWARLPYFSMIWSDNHWMSPGQIARRATEKRARVNARRIYLKEQDVETQLVAAGILDWKRVFIYLIQALEKKLDSEDEMNTNNDSEADNQVKLDFYIPAVLSWIKHNGQRVYEALLRGELGDWNEKDIPSVALKFERPIERWIFWEQRLQDIMENGPDEDTRVAAKMAVRTMQSISGS